MREFIAGINNTNDNKFTIEIPILFFLKRNSFFPCHITQEKLEQIRYRERERERGKNGKNNRHTHTY